MAELVAVRLCLEIGEAYLDGGDLFPFSLCKCEFVFVFSVLCDGQNETKCKGRITPISIVHQ